MKDADILRPAEGIQIIDVITDQFVEYLENSLQTDSIHKHDAGKPYLLMELSDDHPARTFAPSLNPDGGF